MFLETDSGIVRVANHRLMPYIETLHGVCVDVGLEMYVPSPPLRRGMWRFAYGSQEFLTWVTNELPNIKLRNQDDPLSAAQLDAELRWFCDGGIHIYGRDFRCLIPIEQGVWEMKTQDVRAIFWFIFKDIAVFHQGGDANWLHENRADMMFRYRPLIDATVAFRATKAQLPSHISGVRSENVISNRIR